MKIPRRLALPFAVAAAWVGAGSTLLPLPISAAFGAACVLAFPGLCVERLLHGQSLPYGAASAPARWITLSVSLLAVFGLAVTAAGADIQTLLLTIAVASLSLALVPVASSSESDAGADPDAGSDTPANASADLPDSRETASPDGFARGALVCLVVVAVAVAAVAPNVARDRMWYLAFVTQLASGAPIDWSEPFLGTGAIAPRFAYNGWLLALAAWSSLTGAAPALVFERLAPCLLTVAVASAAWHFGRRAVPSAPGLAALASMATMLATRFPFFSPDRYPFFARVAEDKSVALLVFAPVALVAVSETVDAERRPSTATWASLALTLVAVAFGHGLVMLLVGIAIAFLLVLARFGGAVSAPRVLAAIALSAIVAAAPGRMAMMARQQIVDIDEPSAAWSEDVTHPVVRAHSRLGRTRDLAAGGPIVEPTLVAEPLLLVGLAAVALAWWRRRSVGAALLAACSVPSVALAFGPFVAPLFGKIVLPWMAYRALWLVPFGSLAALPVSLLPRGKTASFLSGVVALALFVMTLDALPWDRSSARAEIVAPLGNRETRDVLARISALPADSRIAAAPGFAELVPALAGRAVVAVADRATHVFAGSRLAAEERLRAAAAIVGLAPGSPRVRRAQAYRSGATHFVSHGRDCGRLGRELFRSGPLRLCAIVPTPPNARLRDPLVVVTTTSPERDVGPDVLASLGSGVECKPTPELNGAAYRWKRAGRWTAKPVAVRCSAKIDPPADGEMSVHLSAELPRARESLLVRAVLRTTDGRRVVRHATAVLEGRDRVVLRLPAVSARAIRLRLVPACLPYLNLRELFLRGQRSIGE